MAVFTRVVAILLTAFTAMVLFSVGVFATGAVNTQRAVAQDEVSAAQSCPPVTHPHSTPVRRQCGQVVTLPQTGQPAGPASPISGHEETLAFVAGLLLFGAGGAMVGFRLTTPRARK